MFGYKSFLDFSKAFLMNVFTLLIPFVPRRVGRFISTVFGLFAFITLRGRRRSLISVLKVIRPDAHSRELSLLACKNLINYVNNFADFLRLYHMVPHELISLTEIKGVEKFWQVLEEYHGAILATAHIGNWEVGSNFIAGVGLPLVGVAESAGPGETFYKLFNRYRERFGTNIVTLEDPSIGFKLRKYLRSGHIVGLVGDRDISGSGIEVEFFGKRSIFPQGPAFLSLVTKSPILPSFFLRNEKSSKKVYYAYIEDPIDFCPGEDTRKNIKQLTQLLALRFEEIIRKYPDQWFSFPPPWEMGKGSG
jgi:lauroyl/myristoyl acyltransferase